MLRDKIFPSFFSTAKSGEKRNRNMDNVPEQESKLCMVLRRLCSAGDNTHIYVDTCTLLHLNGADLLEAVSKIFPEYNMELYVPASVMYELENVGNKDSSKSIQSKDIIERLTALEQNGIVRVVLTNSPKFTDAGLLGRFISECQFNDIVPLTQDCELANKAQGLKSFLNGCVNVTHEIKVYKLTAVCSLVENYNCHTVERNLKRP